MNSGTTVEEDTKRHDLERPFLDSIAAKLNELGGTIAYVPRESGRTYRMKTPDPQQELGSRRSILHVPLLNSKKPNVKNNHRKRPKRPKSFGKRR